MSFDKFKAVVEENDTVVLFLGKSNMQVITIDKEKVHQTKHGAFPHADIIGKRFGSKVYSKSRKGWLYILHPTPELWTLTLPHRTQILYTTDISLIIMQLELKPGSTVIESGTGSGSLSHAILRTIKPTGHLYTFDFHEQRVQSAERELKDHDLSKYVSLSCRDVLQDGFNMENQVDAVFLDLPAPWDAIEHAQKALKVSGGRICSFSPCIEQVQRTCDMLRKYRFCEIQTVECLTRILNVHTSKMPEACMSREEISLPKPEPALKKIKLGNECQTNNQVIKEEPLGVVEIGEDNVELQSFNKNEENQHLTPSEVIGHGSKDLATINEIGMVEKSAAITKPGNINFLVSQPKREMPGHTGYLTFATLFPSFHQPGE